MLNVVYNNPPRRSKKCKNIHHQRFPRGPPPQYWVGPLPLSFADRTGCDGFGRVWANDGGDSQLYTLCDQARDKRWQKAPRRGIEPRASAWQAEMLPTTPTRTTCRILVLHCYWLPYSPKTLIAKKWYILDFCVSSLRRGHANLLCIVPILVYVSPERARYSYR